MVLGIYTIMPYLNAEKEDFSVSDGTVQDVENELSTERRC